MVIQGVRKKICLTWCECKGETKWCDECTCVHADWYEVWEEEFVAIILAVSVMHEPEPEDNVWARLLDKQEQREQEYELHIGDTEYLLNLENQPYFTYLLHVELSNGRSIGIKPDGAIEFGGELSEQVVEFWRVLAEGVPLFASEWCEEDAVTVQ